MYSKALFIKKWIVTYRICFCTTLKRCEPVFTLYLIGFHVDMKCKSRLKRHSLIQGQALNVRKGLSPNT